MRSLTSDERKNIAALRDRIIDENKDVNEITINEFIAKTMFECTVSEEHFSNINIDDYSNIFKKENENVNDKDR